MALETYRVAYFQEDELLVVLDGPFKGRMWKAYPDESFTQVLNEHFDYADWQVREMEWKD